MSLGCLHAVLRVWDVDCSQKYGPLMVTDYTAATNVQGYQNGTLILETTNVDRVKGAGCTSSG